MISCFSCVWLFATFELYLPGFSVPGILQERILEWVDVASFRGSSKPGIKPMTPKAPALQADFLPQSHQGSHTIHSIDQIFLHRKTVIVEGMFKTLFKSFPGGSVVKNQPAMQETWVWSLGQEDTLEKEMATHSSILTWKIPWTEEPGGLQSMGLQRVWHDWPTNTFTFIFIT